MPLDEKNELEKIIQRCCNFLQAKGLVCRSLGSFSGKITFSTGKFEWDAACRKRSCIKYCGRRHILGPIGFYAIAVTDLVTNCYLLDMLPD
jgi:hypothetical protein